ncbi:methyltransferase domain-containing protein [Iocasia frigidifontis]|uniref:tRNA 5-hydroxyuridine methyltransferase n=1 Tax=Iocasia fonsfrigidae TaxID=2682810 RepID=A0A8A7K9S7_9FIRM|nr:MULTISPECIES: O-methyltransferase [Halanaerobiaceae]AZO95702.1 O-methyltransferase [Halocella sp. SP3-1]QTL98563.1 methyltransferase domain-containing protein [Iocasia fonsfrigidae]
MDDLTYVLRDIEEKARQEYLPIISPEVGKFLRILVQIKRPERILEVGTATGYSTIWLARAAGQGVELVTIERDEERAERAKKNFHKAGISGQVNLKIGDALEILPLLRRSFDMVFIDAAKGQYLNYLEAVLELLPSGGVIIADNVLYRGYVRKKGLIKHKRRTMVNRLKEYIDVIMNHELLESTILPWGDGLAISVRR